jgi:hypothetical protein
MSESRRGATAAEYGLIAALISVVMIASVYTVGFETQRMLGLVYIGIAQGEPSEEWILGKWDETRGDDALVSEPEWASYMTYYCQQCSPDDIADEFAEFDDDSSGSLDLTEWGVMAADPAE